MAVLESSAAAAGTGSAGAGLPLPEGVEVLSAKGTGRTTGHVISLVVVNTGSQPASLPPTTFYIPSSGQYQSYVGRIVPGPAVPPGATQTIQVTGYCADVHRPPVPDGMDAPPISAWQAPEGPVDQINIPPRAGAAAAGRALVPGTDRTLPRAVNGDQEPGLAAYLVRVRRRSKPRRRRLRRHHARCHRRRGERDHRHDRGVHAPPRPALRGHRQRQGLAHAQRRRHVGGPERTVPGRAPAHAREQGGAVAPRHRDGLRHLRQSP